MKQTLTSWALLAFALIGSAGCASPDLDTSPALENGSADAPAMAMTLLARVERSPSNEVSFYDSEIGIVISETGLAEEAGQHASLEELRKQGMAAAFRSLAKDENAPVPPALLAAERVWLERHEAQVKNPPPAVAPPPGAVQTIPQTIQPQNPGESSIAYTGGSFTNPRPISGSVADHGKGEAVGSARSALGGLSTDAAWWQGLPICQYKTYATDGQFSPAPAVAWYDGVWCVTDVGSATTGWRDTMYYEVTAFGQGDYATVEVYRWNGVRWALITPNTTVSYRHYRTFSYPGDNGAYYYSTVRGNAGQVIGISERYRLAMPHPEFVNNKPSNVEYDFSNDLQGITHDANNWFITRTKYKGIIATPAYGLIAKVPLGTSLDNEPNGQGMPRDWNRLPNGAEGSRYHHFGDVVHVAGKVYVAMNGPAGGAIGVYDTNLNPITFATLDHNSGSAAAYNPKDGFFYVDSNNTTFQKYQMVWNGNVVTAVWKGEFVMRQTIPGAFQGFKFSSKGNLWLLVGTKSDQREFWGIDTASGYMTIQGGLQPGSADECEGLDIFDLDVETRPGMTGQLHLQLLNNQLDNDNWWLMHWRAPMGRL